MEKTELLNQLKIDRSAPAPRRGGNAWMFISALVLILGFAAILWFMRREPPIAVEIATVQGAQAAVANSSVLDATGYVTARRQATVSAKVTGKVERVLIEEGMHVEQGQVLAMLDDVEARAQVALAKAQHQASLSQSAEIRALLNNARREQRRQQDLVRRQLTSKQAAEAAQTQSESLKARLSATQSNAEVAARSLAAAQIQLDNTIIRSPFSGVITVKAAQPGEIISPISAGGGFTRTGIGTVVDMDSLEIQVDISEAFINRVQAGQAVEATLNAYPDWKIPAEVIAIIPTADRTKATVKVRIAFKLKDARIVPEMGVRVAFLNPAPPPSDSTEPQTPAGVLVPAEAVFEKDGADYVFAVKGDRVERRAVSLGKLLNPSQQEVLSGLAVGEQVVVDPPKKLKPGGKIALESGENDE